MFKCSQADHKALVHEQTLICESKTSNIKFTQEFQQRASNARKRLENEELNQAKALKKEQVRKTFMVWTLSAQNNNILMITWILQQWWESRFTFAIRFFVSLVQVNQMSNFDSFDSQFRIASKKITVHIQEFQETEIILLTKEYYSNNMVAAGS